MHHRLSRWFCLAAVCFIPAIAGAQPAASRADGQPAFLGESLFPSSTTAVRRIVSGPGVDFIILQDGFMEGFLPGFPCEVVRGESTVIARILISESLPDFSIALILGLAEGEEIRPGDVVRIQTI